MDNINNILKHGKIKIIDSCDFQDCLIHIEYNNSHYMGLLLGTKDKITKFALVSIDNDEFSKFKENKISVFNLFNSKVCYLIIGNYNGISFFRKNDLIIKKEESIDFSKYLGQEFFFSDCFEPY